MINFNLFPDKNQKKLPSKESAKPLIANEWRIIFNGLDDYLGDVENKITNSLKYEEDFRSYLRFCLNIGRSEFTFWLGMNNLDKNAKLKDRLSEVQEEWTAAIQDVSSWLNKQIPAGYENSLQKAFREAKENTVENQENIAYFLQKLRKLIADMGKNSDQFTQIITEYSGSICPLFDENSGLELPKNASGFNNTYMQDCLHWLDTFLETQNMEVLRHSCISMKERQEKNPIALRALPQSQEQLTASENTVEKGSSTQLQPLSARDAQLEVIRTREQFFEAVFELLASTYRENIQKIETSTESNEQIIAASMRRGLIAVFSTPTGLKKQEEIFAQFTGFKWMVTNLKAFIYPDNLTFDSTTNCYRLTLALKKTDSDRKMQTIDVGVLGESDLLQSSERSLPRQLPASLGKKVEKEQETISDSNSKDSTNSNALGGGDFDNMLDNWLNSTADYPDKAQNENIQDASSADTRIIPAQNTTLQPRRIEPTKLSPEQQSQLTQNILNSMESDKNQQELVQAIVRMVAVFEGIMASADVVDGHFEADPTKLQTLRTNSTSRFAAPQALPASNSENTKAREKGANFMGFFQSIGQKIQPLTTILTVQPRVSLSKDQTNPFCTIYNATGFFVGQGRNYDSVLNLKFTKSGLEIYLGGEINNLFYSLKTQIDTFDIPSGGQMGIHIEKVVDGKYLEINDINEELTKILNIGNYDGYNAAYTLLAFFDKIVNVF
jgi:hypothetical protein